MRAPGYGRGCAFGMFRGAIHPEMGGQDGVLCAHLDFPTRLGHEPGLPRYYVRY